MWKKADWDRYHSSQRFVDALFCYLGSPSHILWCVCVRVWVAGSVRWPATASRLLALCLLGLHLKGPRQAAAPLPGPCRNVRWPLLSLVISTCLCILYGIKADEWNLPHIDHGQYARASFQLCSFAMALILSFRIKVVSQG